MYINISAGLAEGGFNAIGEDPQHSTNSIGIVADILGALDSDSGANIFLDAINPAKLVRRHFLKTGLVNWKCLLLDRILIQHVVQGGIEGDARL